MTKVKRVFLCFIILSSFIESSGKEVSISVDLHKTGKPIHPFVYGQFIEHLGRCIYGGIWAEMLEDRKFYYPVTAQYDPYGAGQMGEYPVVKNSPWEMVGTRTGVKMVTRDAFVGDHSPLIDAGSGIRQKDLTIEAGESYIGYVWAKSNGGYIQVTLGSRQNRQRFEFQLNPGEYRKLDFYYTANEDSSKAELEIEAIEGQVLIGTASLMPADNIRGMRRDTLALLKELNAPIYRWPGGNFVSGYEWRDGIGDRDRRPPRKNPAWTGVEHNDFGTDEFIDFCREIGTEPAIAVNTGFGDPNSAAEWVAYCNTLSDTQAGSRRKNNGHLDPYNVQYWCVGNEMFGTWQLGYMQLHHYTEKHNRTAKAMREVDNSITLIGVGAIGGINEKHDPTAAKANRGWTRGMLESSAEHMTWISEHFYSGRVPWNDSEKLETMEHVQLLKDNIRQIVDRHRKLQPSLPNLNGRTVPIAMDEWNYWHRDYVYGELGCVYDLADALGVAAGLHEYFRNSDIIAMANYAQTVNVIGCIKTSKTDAEFATTGLVLKMYREHFGTIPIPVEKESDLYDLSVALTKDRKSMTLGVVNPTKETLHINIAVTNGNLKKHGIMHLLSGPDRDAHNKPGSPREVDIKTNHGVDLSQGLNVPALSTSLFVAELE